MSSHRALNVIRQLLVSLRSIGILQAPEPTLPPPRIPAAESNGGIRFKDVSDPKVPVQVVINAYPQMQVNDHVELFWNDRFVDNLLVTPEHLIQGSITLDVPSLAIQDGRPPVHYLVTSPNGINQYKSFPLNILVKTTVPGGVDPVPSTPAINENLLAVTGVPELVDESNADTIVATVPPYQNMAIGDRINLSWGGYFYNHEVDASQINQPIPLRIPRETIESAGAGAVVIEYEVRDVVNNWSLWSLKFTPDVEVGSGLLRAPDALDLVAGKLDLAVLGDKDARLRVRVYPDMAEGDEIDLSWVARPPTGGSIEHAAKFLVGADDEGLPITFFVPNATAKASAGGTVAVKYSVASNFGERYSRRTSFEVIGQVQQLPAPTFNEAVGGELDPADIPDDGARITVQPWPGMVSGDRLELFLAGRDGNGNPSSAYALVDIPGGQVDKPVVFFEDRDFFVPLVNGSVEAYYRVNGEDSERLHLRVVGQGGAELLPPTVNGMVNDALDPDDVPNGTRAMVPQYQGKAIGDRITLTWEGLPGSSYSDYIDVTGGNHGGPIGFSIAHTPYIIGNLDSRVTVRYRVTRTGGGTANSEPLEFEVQRKVGEELLPPTVVEAQPNGNLRPFDALHGATVRVIYPSMRVTDRIAVFVTGHNGAASYQSLQQSGSDSGRLDIIVPAHVIGANQGRTPEVHYAVSRGGGEPKLSQPLALQVGTLADNELPTPAIPQANNGVLDLSTFAGDATVRVLRDDQIEPYVWPLWGEGQVYWVVAEGTYASGGPFKQDLAIAAVLSGAQGKNGLSLNLARGQLDTLALGTALTVTLKVAYDKTQTEANARAFPQLRVRLEGKPLPLPAPTVPDAPDGFISHPDLPVLIEVPTAAELALGERVRGVTNGRYTAEVIVNQPGQVLKITVPVEQLRALEGQGETAWSYEVWRERRWVASSEIKMQVARQQGAENWDSAQQQDFYVGTPVHFPSGITVNLLKSDQIGSRVTGIWNIPPHRALAIIGASTIELRFTRSFRRFNASIKYLASPANRIIFKDSKGDVVGSNYLPASDEPVGYTFVAPLGTHISSFEIHAVREPSPDLGFYVDDLLWS